MRHSPALAALIEALRTLPGVGPKSAQRMAFQLLQSGRPAARVLANALNAALDSVVRCGRCRMLTEGELCSTCADPQRDPSLVCVVESPADVVAIEQSGGYRGHYFVLMGHLSPLDEVILATNPTVEGEATAHFFSELVRARGVAASRIAHGVPVGGELEYVDGGTLAHAMAGRHALT
jgi:recombination protein RecR